MALVGNHVDERGGSRFMRSDQITSRPKPRFWVVVFIALLSVFWIGLPFAILNMPVYFGWYVVAMVILVGVGVFFCRLFIGSIQLDPWCMTAILLFSYCVLVTIISSLFFFPNPAEEWIPATSNYAPMLLVLLLKVMDVSIEEVINGMVCAGILSALCSFANFFTPIYFMEPYSMLSGFDATARRVILLKNELAFAVVVLYVRTVSAVMIGRMLVNAGLFALTALVLVIITEVRVVIGACLIAIALYSLFMLRGPRRIVVLMLGVALAATAGPFVFSKYIDQILNSTDFVSQDRSIIWRLLTIEHYRTYFDQTYGIGFGIFSAGQEKNNILTFSYYHASQLYGQQDGGWGLYLADISLYSALFQFGWIALFAVIFMSLRASWSMIKEGYKRTVPSAGEVGILGLLMMFLVINPWPLNLFTLVWSVLSGNLLWYLAAKSSQTARMAGRQRRADVRFARVRMKRRIVAYPKR